MSPTARDGLPPGPRIPSAVQLAIMMRWWPEYVSWCQRRYGKVFRIRNSMVGDMIYLGDPADIKTVFAGDPRIFHAGEANSMLGGILGDTSVLVVDDDVHRDRRRLLMAPFHRDAVAKQATVMADLAAENIAGWPVGRPFPVAPRTSQITLEVILRTVIGVSDPARLAALRDVMPRLLSVGPWDSLAIAQPKLQRRRPWRRLARNIEESDRLLYEEIADCRADPNLAERTDALAMLVRAGNDDGSGMSDKELRDQLITLLVAGHDTTATGLAWALERLTRHPDILAKAVAAAEASAAGDPAGDEYLDAVAKETLRIRPVVPDVGRILKEPVEVAGYSLPAGVMVVPSITLVHDSADVYTRPAAFDPDRMVGATLSPSTWLPFGGGNRRCLGAGFAMTEMRVVLREILRRVELATTTDEGEKTKLKHVIMTPSHGGRITVRALRAVSPTESAPAQAACPVTADSAPS